ncbi:uncharacterized protein PGRI_005970 [Penicillium griseofulvum]|uniref:Uncharacterized protein n=1 Tax=Penicillium patulum TaxID=5078 RepID=A0A135LX54_PENPA|nr:uncharacterized protein PGRI_005970 [Penicillium griseofulvum]KXG53547.1 hypothetical protein PGRI_005970 [Penicillium griseofulvum]
MAVLDPRASSTTTTITATPTATTSTKTTGTSIAPSGYIGIGIGAAIVLFVFVLFIRSKIKERKKKKDRETAEEVIPLYDLGTAFDPQATLNWQWMRSRAAGKNSPLPIIVEPANEADIPALSLQARSVGLSPSPPPPPSSNSPASSPAASSDLLTVEWRYQLPARSPSPLSALPPAGLAVYPGRPSPPPPPPPFGSSSHSLPTNFHNALDDAHKSGRIVRRIGRWVKTQFGWE